MDTVFIAVGLAMDAFAVSITSGLTIKSLQIRHALRIALFFGVFQAVMPLVGWLAGLSVREFIAEVDHWIAFGLLCFIGGKMIYEGRRIKPMEDKKDPLQMSVLLLLSVATSIDALAVGITFAFLNVSILLPVLVIGVITFLFSFSGVYMGDRLGHFFENKIEIVGGLVLIGIGVKIVIEHVVLTP
jgi:putative Mn2+ efflux pump MntP